jgi:hypothetical protein
MQPNNANNNSNNNERSACKSGRRERGIYLQQLAISKHTLLQTSCEEINMVLHQLINSALNLFTNMLRRQALLFESRHEADPIGLDDLSSAVVRELLHKHHHARAQRPRLALPLLDPCVLGPVLPHAVLALLAPALAQIGLEVLEAEQEAEEQLVAGQCDAADDQREREGHVVVEDEGLVAGDIFVVCDVVGVGGGVV